MNYPRVNLLKKSEQRYQGAVSRRFIMVSIVVTPILAIAVLSAVKLLQYTSVQSSLKSGKELWVELEPRFELYKKEQRCRGANQHALELLEGWKDSKIPFTGLLTEIQTAIPASVQLTRLALRGESNATTYAAPEDFGLKHSLIVQGAAYGDRAEETVLGLRSDLLETERMGATFASVELAYMRKRAGGEGQSAQEFSLEGSGEEGEEQ